MAKRNTTHTQKQLKPRIVYLVHANVGLKGGTIGVRVLPLLKNTKNKPLIFSKDADPKLKKQYNIKTVSPLISKGILGLTAANVVLSMGVINKLKSRLLELSFYKALKTHPDVIHSWDFFPKLYKKLKKQNPNCTIIQDVPIAFPNILPKKESWVTALPDNIIKALPYIDIFLAPSQIVKESLINQGVSESRIKIIPFGVDSTKFKPATTKDMQKNNINIAFIGNVNQRKGTKYLINAWKKAQAAGVTGKLNFYGRVYPECMQMVRGKNIVCHGFSKVEDVLAKNDIYVFPSLMEGSSKSTYEALACGLPVITTKNAGSVVTDTKDGFIVPITDSDAIAEKIIQLAKSPTLRKSMGKQARATAKTYTWEKYAENVLHLYSQQNLTTTIRRDI